MKSTDAVTPGMESGEDLKSAGFTGFQTVAALRDESAASVPVSPGVWVVLRDIDSVPRFLSRSTGATWRGQDPTETLDALAARWVAHAYVLYVGTAAGPGVRALLQQRIKRFLRFGSGRNVAHWSGRFVWQLAGASALRIAWRVVPAAAARREGQRFLAAFAERYGVAPFANETGDDDE